MKSVYQTPAIPRFYIDDFQFLTNIGWTANHPNYTVDGEQSKAGHFFYDKKSCKGLLSLQPHISKYATIPYPGGSVTYDNAFVFDNTLFADQNMTEHRAPVPSTAGFFGNKLFCAALNHTMKDKFITAKARGSDEYGTPDDTIVDLLSDDTNPFTVNWADTQGPWVSHGWSLQHLRMDEVPEFISGIYPCFGLDGEAGDVHDTLGSWVVGHWFDLEHATNLEVTMGYDYEGYKANTTIGGSTSVNIHYIKSPMWGVLGQMEMDVDGWTGPYDHMPQSRTGRRFWDLTFSMYDRTKIFPENSMISPDHNFDSSGSAETEGLGDDIGFYAKVIHRTLGGALPFIFLPDKENPNPDTFAICRFDQDRFEFKQTAPNIWEFDLRIIEAW